MPREGDRVLRILAKRKLSQKRELNEVDISSSLLAKLVEV